MLACARKNISLLLQAGAVAILAHLLTTALDLSFVGEYGTIKVTASREI